MAEAIYLSLKVSTFDIEGHTENRTPFFSMKRAEEIIPRKNVP